MAKLDSFPAVAPILRTSEISVETWFDDRMPPDRYGEPQKHSYAAMTLRNRVIKNGWSKVTLRVMYAAAREAGVMLDDIQEDDDFNLPDELKPLCDKAVAMGKAVRSEQSSGTFSQDEIDTIARRYIHCSANWNAIIADMKGYTRAAHPQRKSSVFWTGRMKTGSAPYTTWTGKRYETENRLCADVAGGGLSCL